MKSKKYIQQNYIEELDNQILNNQRLKGRANRTADDKTNKEMEDEDRKFRNQQNEEGERQKRLREEFLKGNRALISMRNAKNQRDKIKEENMGKTTSFFDRQNDEEERHRKEKEEYKKQTFQRDLDNQIKQKQREKQRDLERDKENVGNRNIIGGCTCQGMGICSNCKKSYPLSFLNPRRNYADLYRRKKL